MIHYLITNPDKIYIPLLQHLEIVLITLIISVLLATILTVLSVEIPKLGTFLVQLFSVIYSIPSMALFALLIPLTGLGMPSAITVLVIYNQYLLLRNFLTGLQDVDPGIREAALGIGMTKLQILRRIQLPLSKPAIFTGIRLAMVSTVGIATIASCINAGGLGDLLFSGMRTQNIVKILWGSVLSAGLAIVLDLMLKYAENRTKLKLPKSQVEEKR
ncbi:MAG: ABC transporter permease [Bilifractor sp.]